MKSQPPYNIFDHTADLGLEIYGGSLAELFCHAAIALFDSMTEIARVVPRETRYLDIMGLDREDLLVNFLRELLYLFNGEGLLLKDFLIQELDAHHLKGEVRGEFFDYDRHVIKREIKAVTYHQLKIRQTSKGWKGRVIFDV